MKFYNHHFSSLIFHHSLNFATPTSSIGIYQFSPIHIFLPLYYTMSLELSSSEGRYRRRRRRNDCQTLSTSNCVVESSSILQCTAAVVFPTLPSTNVHTEVPSNRIYRTDRHRTRRKSVPMSTIYLFMSAMMIISIAVNNCCCYAFQSPAVIQSRTQQHGLVSIKVVFCVAEE